MFCPVCRADYPADYKVCPKDATHLLASPQIGKYRIEGLLGVGGMGAVYRAVNPDTKARVAIKLMNPEVASAESARARFQREAAAVAALRTTHVVKVYDFGTEADGTLYLVMELLDGHSLRAEIRSGPDLMDLARVQHVMDGVLKGLAAAHRAGIVHRDLKPDNVFVADTDDGEVPKLLDFGIARVQTKDSDLTRTGSLMGTAAYMAVEQVAAGSGEVGPWSDVYAMGTILYEMLTGSPAFGGTTITEVLHRVLTAERVPLATERPGLPDAVYDLVERCLSLDSPKRPQDAEAMRVALLAARLVPPGTSVPPPNKKAKSSSTPPPDSSPGALAATAAASDAVIRRDSSPSALAATSAAPITGGSTSKNDATSLIRKSPTKRDSSDAIAATMAATSPATVATTTSNNDATAVARPSGKAGSRPSAPSRSRWPLILGGLVLAGVGGVFAVRKLREVPAAPPRDASVVVIVDPPVPTDAAAKATAIDAEIDAAPAAAIDAARELTADMTKIAAGEHELGEDTAAHPDALARTRATLPDLWIDRTEVTLGALRTALGDPAAGGAPGDGPALPARRVTWQQASRACAAMGKRLPSEAEWEAAARTTPRDPASATLLSGKPALVAATTKDCSADGLCDMLGSVVEWTEDDWRGTKGAKVARGASFAVSPNAGWSATIHARAAVQATTADPEVGFRCVIGERTTVAVADPPPAQCDSKEHLDAARAANRAGNHAKAIEHATLGLTCGGDPLRLHAAIVYAACKRKEHKLVMQHYYVVSRRRIEDARTICARQTEVP